MADLIGVSLHPSIDLRGIIPNSLKGLTTPKIAYVDRWDAAGSYYQPEDAETLIGGRWVDLSSGLIVVCNQSNEGTVAHEWRHHWQFMNGWKYDGIGWPPRNMQRASYWEQIRAYFRRSRSEMDAFTFERKIVTRMPNGWEDAIFSARI